jgi:hypothetical protein
MSTVKAYDKDGNFEGYVPWDHLYQLKDFLKPVALHLGEESTYFDNDGNPEFIIEWEKEAMPNDKR